MKTTAMKKLFILACLSALLATPALFAAPAMKPADVSEDTLKGVASDKQKASIENHERAKQKAEDKRKKEIQDAKDETKKNDDGLKRTIQKRLLNSMLPPCDREPETPREPHDYNIRY